MAKEKDITNPILKAASKLGARLFRQNTGVGYVGRTLRRTESTLTLADPRPLHAGLCVGSSDIIGWTPIEITPDMVGARVAVFTALEVKTGRLTATDEQERFIAAVRSAGGIAGVVRSDTDALSLILAPIRP